MNFKKIISLLMIATMLVCSLISCNDPDEGDPCTHIDTDNNGVCDTCKDGLPTVTYTVTVKDDSNQPVAGVEVGLDVTGAADVVYATTDNSGVATFTVDTNKTNRRIEAFIEDYDEKYKLGDNDAHTFAQGERSCTLGLVELDAYYIYAKDSLGDAVAGVHIQACTSNGTCKPFKITNEEGYVVFYGSDLAYATVIDTPNGYITPDSSEHYDIESSETIIIILAD